MKKKHNLIFLITLLLIFSVSLTKISDSRFFSDFLTSVVYADPPEDGDGDEENEEEEEEKEEEKEEVKQESKGSENDFSFYQIASAASAYFDDVQNGKSDKYDKENYAGSFASTSGTIPVRISNAGSYLGFVDEDYNSGLFGATLSSISSSSQSRSYERLKANEAMSAYVQYGHALSSLGIDSVGNEALGIDTIGRSITGGLMIIFYCVALGVDILFTGLISIIKALNPFSWFIDAFDGVAANYASSFVDGSGGAFDGIKQLLSSMYKALRSMGILLATLILAGGVAVALIMKGGQGTGSKFGTFFKRLLFIMLGIPLLGVTYTQLLDQVDQTWGAKGGVPYANRILASTFVDFESWAEKGRLALPEGCKISIDVGGSSGGVVNMGNTTNLRGMARSINATYSNLLPVGASDLSSFQLIQADTPLYDGAEDTQKGRILAGIDLLTRYTQTTFYHASDFESSFKSNIGDLDEESVKAFYESIKIASDYKNYANSDEGEKDVGDGVSIATPLVVNNNPSMPYFTDGNDAVFGAYYKSKDKSLVIINGHGGPSSKGLNSLSMYNYLTTEFSDSSVMHYSLKKVSSKVVQVSHRSVNLIGTGAVSVLYYLNSLIAFAVFGIIGIYYGIGMLINAVVRSIKMVLSIPLATIGFTKSIVKVLTYTVMLLLEILGTALIYNIVIEIFMALNSVVETPLQEIVLHSNRFGLILPGATIIDIFSSPIVITVFLVISIVVNLFFLKGALKLRSHFVKSLNEVVGNAIDKIVSPNAAPGEGLASSMMKGSPSATDAAKARGKRAAQAVGNVAGHAASGYMSGKAYDKFSKGEKADGNVTGAESKENAEGESKENKGASADDDAKNIENDDTEKLESNEREERGKNLLNSTGGLDQLPVPVTPVGPNDPSSGGASEKLSEKADEIKGKVKGTDALSTDPQNATSDVKSSDSSKTPSKDVQRTQDSKTDVKSDESRSKSSIKSVQPGKSDPHKESKVNITGSKKGAEGDIKSAKPLDSKSPDGKAKDGSVSGAKPSGKSGAKSGVKGLKPGEGIKPDGSKSSTQDSKKSKSPGGLKNVKAMGPAGAMKDPEDRAKMIKTAALAATGVGAGAIAANEVKEGAKKKVKATATNIKDSAVDKTKQASNSVKGVAMEGKDSAVKSVKGTKSVSSTKGAETTAKGTAVNNSDNLRIKSADKSRAPVSSDSKVSSKSSKQSVSDKPVRSVNADKTNRSAKSSPTRSVGSSTRSISTGKTSVNLGGINNLNQSSQNISRVSNEVKKSSKIKQGRFANPDQNIVNMVQKNRNVARVVSSSSKPKVSDTSRSTRDTNTKVNTRPRKKLERAESDFKKLD